MITIQTKRYQNGAQIQKIRLFNHVSGSNSQTAPQTASVECVRRTPTLSASDILARRLLSLCQSSQHPRLQGNANFFRKLLDRIGVQKALDTALECLVSGHEALGRNEPASNWLNTRLYSRAIRAVQEAIDDDRTRYTTETLAAVDVLWRTEGFFGYTKTVDGVAADDRTIVRDQMVRNNHLPRCNNRLTVLSTYSSMEKQWQTCLIIAD